MAKKVITKYKLEKMFKGKVTPEEASEFGKEAMEAFIDAIQTLEESKIEDISPLAEDSKLVWYFGCFTWLVIKNICTDAAWKLICSYEKKILEGIEEDFPKK